LTHVTYAGGVAPPPTIVDIAPEADSYVQSYYPNNNYGSSTIWGAGMTQAPNRVRAFLRFPLTGIPPGKTILEAQLRQYVYSIWGTVPYYRRFDLHFVSDDTWGELTITYNNQPAPGAILVNNTLIDTTGWKSYDITSQVTTEYQGDGKISLRWRDHDEDLLYYEGWYAYSKEYTDANYRPRLRVTYQ